MTRAVLLGAVILAGCSASHATSGCGSTSDGLIELSTISRALSLCTYAQSAGRSHVEGEDPTSTATFVLDVTAGTGTFGCETPGQVSLRYTDASGQNYLASSQSPTADRLGACSVTATASDATHWAGQVTASLRRNPDLAPLSLTASLDLHGT